MTLAPVFVNGMVIVGLAGGEFQVRGQVIALDASTRRVLWRTFTTQPGTWAGNSRIESQTKSTDANLTNAPNGTAHTLTVRECPLSREFRNVVRHRLSPSGPG